jgi:hypothetical protein
MNVTLQYSAMNDTYELWLRDKTGDTYYYAEPVMMVKAEEGAFNPPAFRIDTQAAKNLMDDLWNAGVRPSNLKHSKEIIDSLNSHIDDFRKIIFNQLNIK